MPTINEDSAHGGTFSPTPAHDTSDAQAEVLIRQLREAAESPYLAHATGPAKPRSTSQSPGRRSASHKHRHDSPERHYRGDYHPTNLKYLLRSTSDRLEHEVRRADEAIARAEYATLQADQNFNKSVAAQQALHEMELRARRAEIETVTSKRQLENAEDRVKQMERMCTDLEDSREEAVQRASQLKKELRELQLSVRSHEARDQGWEEGVKIGMMKRLNEERQKLWNAGHSEGAKIATLSATKEGIRIGRREGLMEGREDGRREERRNALEAFQVFLAEEMDGTDEWRSEWTRRWVESVYHADSLSSVSSQSYSRAR